MVPLAVDYQGGIQNAWSNVATFVPKLVAALLIVLVGYFVAKLISRILDRILERVGFDRVVERGGVRQALARSKYDPSDILAKQGGQLLAKGAGIAILVFAAFAALDQLQIAPRIVTGLWYALLAAVVGSVIVAVGGGGIRPMQRYWERAASRAEERGPQLRQQVQQSAQSSPTATYDTTVPAPEGATAVSDSVDNERRSRFRRGR